MAIKILDEWMRTLVAYVRSGEPDLTNRQMAILLLVRQTCGPHTVRGLAAALSVSKPVVTRALNKLASLGFLRRQRDENDKRNIFVKLTDRGARFLTGFQAMIGQGGPAAPTPTTLRSIEADPRLTRQTA